MKKDDRIPVTACPKAKGVKCLQLTTVDKDVVITKHQILCTWQKCVHAVNNIHAALGQQITNAKLDKHSR